MVNRASTVKRVPEPRRARSGKGIGVFVFIFVGLLIFIFVGLSPDTKRATELATFCKSNPGEVKSVYDSWVRAGVIKGSQGYHDIVVEDAAWDGIPMKMKISIGIAVYCQEFGRENPPTGTVHMWGYRDGKIKASVHDGNYFD